MTLPQELAAPVLTDLLFEEPGVGRCLVAPDGSILRVNGEWLRSTGFRLDDVLGADIVGLFPDTRDMALAMHARARAGHRVEVPRHALRVQGRETWWEGSIAPVPMEGGTGLLVTVREVAGDGRPGAQEQDAADWKRDEMALRASEERFRLLTEAMPQIVCVLGPDGAPEYVNTSWAAFSGLDLAATRRVGWEGVVHPDDLAVVRECRRRALKLRKPQDVEVRYRAADGTHRWFLSRLAPVVADGRVVRLVGAAMDIDDRKRMEAALRDEDRRKTEFLGVLSHELRNPLAPIRNSIYLLERAAPGSEQATRAREVLRRQAEHLTRLIDDLLDVTRISRGKIALQRARVDLREIVRKTTDDVHSVFTQAGVELRVDYRTLEPLWIEADPTRIAQVLGNLLQNAVKFTPNGGTVAVRVSAEDGRAELAVRDSGIGMEPATVEHMFEPFAQAQQTLARTQGGLGLGLALVKGLVELHGGAVEARSDGVGRGATFVVRLPLSDAGPARIDDSAAGAVQESRLVLVIEDNVDAGQSLAEILELYGHRVRVARDGHSGLALARELGLDVILCDIGLPDVDGYEVARTLKGDAELRSIRLVALSGYAQPEDRDRALAAGFDAHLAKPPDLDALARALVDGA
ncbi:MAG TPA: ATP-binding protein [Anaeromyxobacter sp.]